MGRVLVRKRLNNTEFCWEGTFSVDKVSNRYLWLLHLSSLSA